MEQVTIEELEALEAKVVEYESILEKNQKEEKELAELKQQTAALEAKKAAGETHGK